MKKLLYHIVDTCYDKEYGLKKRMIFSLILILLGLGIMIWFFYRLLYIEEYWDTKNNIHLPSAGTIGDFVGGVSGTLFTLVGIVLLFETLALQRKELSESRGVFEKQQFENTFFNLINLYHEIVRGLHYETKNSVDDKIYTGKEFFERHHKDFVKSFSITSNTVNNRRKAKIHYLEFYTSTKEQTAHYFRVIYRIFKYIKNSKLDNDQKIAYSKIVRAQFSESELFFIHYNALLEYGAKFRTLINEYNITKHLPAIEKVEYLSYSSKLSHLEKNSVQLVLEDIIKSIKLALINYKDSHKTYLQGHVTIMVKYIDSMNISLRIVIKDGVKYPNAHQQGNGLQNFTPKELENFLTDFLFDSINYSNYFELNNKQISISSKNNYNNQASKHIIEINANSTNNEPIKIL